MEQVRKSIQDVLGNDEMTTAVINRLLELGVTCEGDVVEIQVADLTPSVLLPIPARKLIRHWSKSSVDENHNSVTSVNTALMRQNSSGQYVVASQPGTPIFRVVPTTPPSSLTTTPPTSSTTTPLSLLNSNGSSWANKFDVRAAVMEMAQQGQLTEQTAARHLTEGKPLPHAERNEVIRHMTSCILKVCSTPCRKTISVIAEALVTSYPQLQDEIGGTVIGPGYLSIRNQLENRVAYLKRPLSNQRRVPSARRRLDSDEPAETSSSVKRMRDGYGCVDFLPVDLPDGESNDSLKLKHLQLKSAHRSGNGNWNRSEISQLMQQTYILQRQDLVGCKPLSVRDIQVEWPFLCESSWMLEHLQRLLGISLIEKLEANLMAKKDTLLQYFKSVAPTMRELGQKLSQVDVSQPAVGVILPLMSYFGEPEAALFRGYELMPDSTDLEIAEDMPNTPCLLYEGSSFHTGRKFRVMVDRVVLCIVDTPLAGLALTFGCFFLFNIAYPPEAGATLEYVQRVLLGVNPSSGSKIARTRGKKVRSGVHEAVLSLIRELALFSDLDN